DARIWWVADPLFMIPGNERRTEHYSRVLHTLLQENSVNTYGSSWGGDLAELVLRFGWAEKWTQEPSRSMYPEAQASVTGHEREPGYHFFLKIGRASCRERVKRSGVAVCVRRDKRREEDDWR